MSELPLLRFKPILREYLWGGRRLAELGKVLGSGEHYAESWEVVDHGADQSIVADGPLAGSTLHEIVANHGEALFGRHSPQRQFPLLLKFLDCQQTLSVQVHPNDEQASKLNPPDLGKTEAWVVLAAEPGSRIYAGLRPGVDRATIERELAGGECGSFLHQFEPAVGDCLLIEAGTVHALGAGLLIAEIQQASDTTFRLCDWNRVDAQGKPRPLHIEQALETIDFNRGPVQPLPAKKYNKSVSQLASCDKFVIDRWKVRRTLNQEDNDRFHIIAVIDGGLKVVAGESKQVLYKGDTVLVPACCKEVTLRPVGQVGRRTISTDDEVAEFKPRDRTVVLDMYLP
jgi:mannose-6-phosphate isomerase